jgi:hypothetical protein
MAGRADSEAGFGPPMMDVNGAEAGRLEDSRITQPKDMREGWLNSVNWCEE